MDGDAYFAVVRGELRVSYSPWTVADAMGRLEPNHDAVADMLYFPALPASPEASLLAGVKRLRHTSRDPVDTRMAVAEKDASVEGLHQSIRDSVARSIGDATKVGVLTTGGLDSAVVAALARDSTGCAPVLFAIRGGLSSPLECELQDSLAAELGAELVIIEELPPFSINPLIARNHNSDFPTGGAFTHVWDEAVTLAKSYGIEVLLTGEGGNEVFSPGLALMRDQVASRQFGLATATLGRCRDSFDGGPIHRLWRGYRGFLPEMPQRGASGEVASGWRGGYAKDAASSRNRRTRQVQSLRSLGLEFCEIDARIALERHELYDAGGAAKQVRVASPLTSPKVIESFAAVPASLRNPVRVGTQDKHLLRLIGRQHLSPRLTEMRKVGRSDQLTALLGSCSLEEELGRLKPGARWLGLGWDDKFENPRALPVEVGLAWTRTLALCAWALNASGRDGSA